MSESKHIHFALNLSKIRDRQIHEYIMESGKGQKEFIVDCIEAVMTGSVQGAPAGEAGNALVLKELAGIKADIKQIFSFGFVSQEERPKVSAPLPGQIEVSELPADPGDDMELEAEDVDDSALDFLDSLEG